MAIPEKDLRVESRKDWITTAGANPTTEQLMLGCQLRIADAIEAMAKNYQALTDERDRYKKRYMSERRDNASVRRSNQALRAVITKMKNKK